MPQSHGNVTSAAAKTISNLRAVQDEFHRSKTHGILLSAATLRSCRIFARRFTIQARQGIDDRPGVRIDVQKRRRLPNLRTHRRPWALALPRTSTLGIIDIRPLGPLGGSRVEALGDAEGHHRRPGAHALEALQDGAARGPLLGVLAQARLG